MNIVRKTFFARHTFCMNHIQYSMDFMNIAVHFTFQEEILKEVGHEAFELGLLKEKEFDTREEDPTQKYSFYDLVLVEFLAAKFVATLDKVSFDR